MATRNMIHFFTQYLLTLWLFITNNTQSQPTITKSVRLSPRQTYNNGARVMYNTGEVTNKAQIDNIWDVQMRFVEGWQFIVQADGTFGFDPLMESNITISIHLQQYANTKELLFGFTTDNKQYISALIPTDNNPNQIYPSCDQSTFSISPFSFGDIASLPIFDRRCDIAGGTCTNWRNMFPANTAAIPITSEITFTFNNNPNTNQLIFYFESNSFSQNCKFGTNWLSTDNSGLKLYIAGSTPGNSYAISAFDIIGSTKFPTTSPTAEPTKSPTKKPTNYPSIPPTKYPTNIPTQSPTKYPSISPSKYPTKYPTNNPSKYPTKSPTYNPTNIPSQSPTKNPSLSPSKSPSMSPTKYPSNFPTIPPTKYPTISPTKFPTISPTKSPTYNPTNIPSQSPTNIPSLSPSKSPSKYPTNNPSKFPTKSPTYNPTNIPSLSPSKSPSKYPTISPTKYPSVSPSRSPTKHPSITPTQTPSNYPSIPPTISPIQPPTTSPSKYPTNNPSITPTYYPTITPTKIPTNSPTSITPAPITTKPTWNPSPSPTTVSPSKSPITVSPSASPIRTLPFGFQWGAYDQLCSITNNAFKQCGGAGSDILTDTFGNVLCNEAYDCCLCKSIKCGLQQPCNELQVVGEYGIYGVKDIQLFGGAIDCQGTGSCKDVIIYGNDINFIDCDGNMACQNSNMEIINPIQGFILECAGVSSCQGLKINIKYTAPNGRALCNNANILREMSKIMCTNDRACDGLEITVTNEGCGTVNIRELECVHPTGCDNAIFNLGDTNIEYCNCGPSCNRATGLDKCFANLDRFLCSDPYVCADIIKTIENPINGFEFICSSTESCKGSKFIIEFNRATRLENVDYISLFLMGGEFSGADAVFTIDNKQGIIMTIGTIECSGYGSCNNMVFILGTNVSVEKVICANNACLNCVIKRTINSPGLPCDPSQVSQLSI